MHFFRNISKKDQQNPFLRNFCWPFFSVRKINYNQSIKFPALTALYNCQCELIPLEYLSVEDSEQHIAHNLYTFWLVVILEQPCRSQQDMPCEPPYNYPQPDFPQHYPHLYIYCNAREQQGYQPHKGKAYNTGNRYTES